MEMLASIWQFLGFLMRRKKYWLLPVVVLVLLLAGLSIVAQGSGVAAPLLYTLF